MRLPSLALTVLLLATPVAAQSGAEAYVQQASDAFGAPVGDLVGPSASVEALAATLLALPVGTNGVVLNQSGLDNAIVAEQTGLDNRAALSQIGSGNRTTILQDGSDNLFTAAVFGSDNRVTTNQIGDSNTYGLVMIGRNLEHTVTQRGSGNTATQFVASGVSPVDIEQRGNGLQVVVERY